MPETLRLAFDAWMAQVNSLVEASIGVSADDLPDWEYHDAWDAGMAPEDAVEDILAENGVDW